MINRKALWISGVVFLVLLAATLWRLSLLPDWHHLPADGPGSSRVTNGLWLLWGPFALLLTMAALFARRWFMTGPEDSLQSWRRYGGAALVCNSMMIAVMQVFVLARSLGLGLDIERQTVGRSFIMIAGILIIGLGNILPKMPWMSARLRFFRLDPYQWNRQSRFGGRIMVAMGLALTIGGALLSPQQFLPLLVLLWLATLAANIWHRARLKREPSPQ